MPSWNYRPAVRRSWVTGLPTLPSKPCVVRKGEADQWAAYEYVSGKRGRVATGYRPGCVNCAADYCHRQNERSGGSATEAPPGPPAA